MPTCMLCVLQRETAGGERKTAVWCRCTPEARGSNYASERAWCSHQHIDTTRIPEERSTKTTWWIGWQGAWLFSAPVFYIYICIFVVIVGIYTDLANSAGQISF